MERKVILKLMLVVLICWISISTNAQKKGNYIYIVNEKIVATSEVNKYMKEGRIKTISINTSDSLREHLLPKIENINVYDATFMIVNLKTDAEIKADKYNVKKGKTLTEIKKELKIKGKESTKVQLGEIAPDFTVIMLNEKQIKLSDLRGKVVMLNFWATWCSPCMQEFKKIPQQIINRFKNDDFVLLPISRGEKQEIVEKKMKRLKLKGIDFLVGLDPQKKIYNKYASKYIPRNFIIDKKGKIVFISVGNSEEKMHNMIRAIQKALKK